MLLFVCLFWPCHAFPDQGLNPGPQQSKLRILTPGPPGNSLISWSYVLWLYSLVWVYCLRQLAPRYHILHFLSTFILVQRIKVIPSGFLSFLWRSFDSGWRLSRLRFFSWFFLGSLLTALDFIVCSLKRVWKMRIPSCGLPLLWSALLLPSSFISVLLSFLPYFKDDKNHRTDWELKTLPLKNKSQAPPFLHSVIFTKRINRYL